MKTITTLLLMSPKLGKNQLEGTLDLILTMPPESEAGLGKGDMVLTLMLPPEAGAGAGADLDLSQGYETAASRSGHLRPSLYVLWWIYPANPLISLDEPTNCDIFESQ